MQVGPYVLEAELGRGGMGAVWRAHDPALGRTVAIKVLLQPLASPAELDRFRREAQAQARLRHPLIAGVHACGATPAGQPYLALDYVEGQSLAARLAAGPLPVEEGCRLVARLARAIDHAHARGVLHRDLKARNVMLTPGGDPVLLDFGLAALAGAERLTATGETMGTPGCLAPEQALGDRARIGPRTDVYGLGVVLHEALTGRPPFEGREVVKLLADVVEQPAPPPSRMRPGLDPRVDAVALRCLEKDPARRWPTALALAEALEELDRPPRAARRRARGLRLALAACGAAAIGGWIAGRASTPPAAPGDGAAAHAAGAAATTTGAAADTTGAAADTTGAAADTTAPPAAGPRSLEEEGRARLRSAREALARGEPRAALAELDRAVALDPGVEACAARALVRVTLGDSTGARRDLLDLAGRAEPEALVLAARGLVLTDEPEGLEAARRAVDATGGESGAALAARALARALQNDLAGARADAEAARRLAPDDPLALLAEAGVTPDPLALLERAAEVAASGGDGLARAVALTALAKARVPTLLPASDARLTRALAELDEALLLAPALRQALGHRAALRASLDPAALERGVADAELLVRLQEWREPTSIELLVFLRARRALDPSRGLDRPEADRALNDLGAGLVQRPGDPALLGARAELRLALGDLVGAEADAREALRLSAPPSIVDRAAAALARVRCRRGATGEALAVAGGLIDRLRGRASHCLAERALVHALLGDAAAATADAERAIALDGTLVRGHYARARALLLSGARDAREAARRSLQEALRLSPGFGQARAELAILRVELGEQPLGAALRAVREAVALQPWAPEHPCAEAALAEVAGDAAATEAALARAIALDPAWAPARLHRGRRRLATDPRAALADLLLAAELQPGSAEAWAGVAAARRALGDDEGALEAVARAVPGDASRRPLAEAAALRVRAAILLGRGDPAGALPAASRAAELEPTAADGLWLRGRARLLTDDAAGVEDLAEALRRAPGDARRAELAELLRALPEGPLRRRVEELGRP